VGDVHSNLCHGRWIRREGPTAWLPSLPDFNSLDFYLWGNLRTLVYVAPFDNEETLHHRIVDACQTIHNYPGIFERRRRPMIRHVEACIESHGGHFEHLVQVNFFSYNSQIKCFRTHVHMDILSCFVMWNSCPDFVRNLSFTLSMQKGLSCTSYRIHHWQSFCSVLFIHLFLCITINK
jgi:hypothetical protein